MSEGTSLISMHPFVNRFVLSIIQTIRDNDFSDGQRFVVDADFVPNGSEKVATAVMSSLDVRNQEPSVSAVEVKPVQSRDMSELVAPIGTEVKSRVEIRPIVSRPVQSVPEVRPEPIIEVKPIVVSRPIVAPRPVVVSRPVVMPPVRIRRAPPRRVAPPIQIAPKMDVGPAENIIAPPVVVASEGAIDESEEYGKIAPLLNDPSVSTIECLGEGKELMIIRAGQRQKTRIILDKDEVRGVLDKVADSAHIPLLEGVFRASVKGFSVNAVVSEMVGNKFVVKKATAYGLLE